MSQDIDSESNAAKVNRVKDVNVLEVRDADDKEMTPLTQIHVENIKNNQEKGSFWGIFM